MMISGVCRAATCGAATLLALHSATTGHSELQGASASPLGAKSGAGGCPVCPSARAAMMPQPASGSAKQRAKAAGCPMHNDEEKDDAQAQAKAPVYNVYSQKINPENQMPVNPNNFPAEGQSRSISVVRKHSTIPKGGTQGTWTFPSPQMFYNALKRKEKADDVSEADMEHVVSVHNSMNQQTWAAVAAWEQRFHCEECASPALSRFRGRPYDLSPKARLYTLLGYDAPFDRHDWVVDRCGKEVRYIIDFYWLAEGGGNTNMPAHVESTHEARTISIDVRPAVDSIGSAWDILRVWASGADLSRTLTRPQPTLAPKGPSKEEVSIIDTIRERIQTHCGAQQRRLDGLGANAPEEEYVAAAQSLSLCMGRQFCPDEANRFIGAATAGDGDAANAEFEGMMGCLRRYELYAEQVQAAAEVAAKAKAQKRQ